MRKIVVIFMLFAVLLAFFGCDYYKDEHIGITFSTPDSTGLVEYQAGISTDKNAARINLLRYQLNEIRDGQVKIKLPETLRSESGREYAIKQFGGSTGVNAPVERFNLIIHVEGGAVTETPITLTVDVGTLPLDTSHWNDVLICYSVDNTETRIPVEDVIFISDEPLVYRLSLSYKDPSGETSDATYSDEWYEKPDKYQTGGEKVTVKIKHPKGNIKRELYMHYTKLEPVAVYSEYIQYEFIMPYDDMRITITDTAQ